MKIQSNGMGQQSAALYLMSAEEYGGIPYFDYSVFADPGREKSDTYKYLNWLSDQPGPDLVVINNKNLYQDLLKGNDRVASIPMFTENGGIVRRQCTTEYKINQVNSFIRLTQGKGKGESFDPVDVYFGISLDEIRRMSTPERKNVTHVYPFCGYKVGRDGHHIKIDTTKMTRGQINKWMDDRGYPIPPKSSCVFCPFTSNSAWQELKMNHPEDFTDAVKIDEAIRDQTARGLNEKMYLHRSLKPLKDIDFTNKQISLFDSQGEDCYGYCGI